MKYDVIVIGGGHAGCEAAHASAKLGSKVLMITQNLETIARMSCNPAMGGVAKGQILREIDALGGMSAIVTDESMIQFRMLNRSKGPAMWSPRAQCDKKLFEKKWRYILEQNKNIDFKQDTVKNLIIKSNKVCGVITMLGNQIFSNTVILCSGTFMNGIIHLGLKNYKGGRSGEPSAKGITKQLIDLGFEHGRMKTGTPPRLDGRTIDYNELIEQAGDKNPGSFSFTNTSKLSNQLSCFITYTNSKVHEILQEGFEKSPMFTGRIQGVGPRYCPSIEDKIDRFKERERHQLFIEPEGRETVEIYLNGFSTSLPEEVQVKALRHVNGLENAKLFRAGYAIEYDYFPPTQLNYSLETKLIKNLFFCGQINGTTGYEEAGCQGLIAGINAHRKCKGLSQFILKRSDAYIGVLIDDLITKGTDEPYRMFTSRAEYRLLLRQDNADIRLTKIGYEIGLIDRKRYDKLESKIDTVKKLEKTVKRISAEPIKFNSILSNKKSSQIKQKLKLDSLLSRPNINFNDLKNGSNKLSEFINDNNINKLEEEQVEINIKYGGYLKREKDNVEKSKRLEDVKIPDDFEFHKLHSISSEAKEKLSSINPKTIGQAKRISGVSPADVNVLLVYMGR